MDYKRMISALDNRGRFRIYVKGLGLEIGETVHDNKDVNLDWLILLNKHNSKIIEEEIKKDDGYIQFTKMLVHYHCLTNKANQGIFPKYDRNAVLAIVRMIDVENSTNVWRFNRDKLHHMVNYIVVEESRNKFWSRLDSKNEKDRKQLVIDLADSKPDEEEEGSSENKAKPNSLASKVCKYFAQYICNDKDQEWYFINDLFVRKTLSYYYYYYLGKDATNNDNINWNSVNNFKYDELFDALDKIRNKANKNKKEKITRGEMDHIMWYCYKNSGNTGRSLDDEKIYILCEKAMLAYGAFPVNDALEILNKDRRNPLTINSFKQENIPDGCVIRDGYILNSSISEERINHLIELSKTNEVYDIKKIERLSTLAVIENTNALNLLSYLIDTYGEENRDLIITKIKALLNEAIAKGEIDLEATFATFTNLVRNKTIDGTQVNTIKTRIKKVLNETRLPKYLGHTAKEVGASII